MTPEERARSDATIVESYDAVREARWAGDWSVLPGAAYRLYLAAQRR